MTFFKTLLCMVMIGTCALAADSPTPARNPESGENAQPAPQAEKARKTSPEKQDEIVTITADSLEMDMERGVAILTDNVMAADSSMQLTAKKAIVHIAMKKDASQKDGEPKKAKKRGPSLIEVIDNVTLRKMDTLETVTGDKGVFDAENNTITLTGNCTLITKDKESIQGNKAVYDMATRQIRVSGAIISFSVSGDALKESPFSKKDKDSESKSDVKDKEGK